MILPINEALLNLKYEKVALQRSARVSLGLRRTAHYNC